MFELRETTPEARRGVLKTPHGDLQTPFFMPIATKGAVKTLSSVDIEKVGSPIILSNTYHLLLRPGMDVMKQMGGLHRLMGWNGALLTDSGGYQVLSLSDRRKVTEEGVEFSSPLDGSKHLLTPESSIDIQRTIGSDIVMCFDELIDLPGTREDIHAAAERTTRWAKRCKDRFEATRKEAINPDAQLFGIIQGGTYPELRKKSAQDLLEIGFDGYAIGGIVADKTFESALEALGWIIPMLPEDKPRYFMGGARPDQVVEYVKHGVDMFDCVLPTRNARHGHLYRWVHDDLSKPDFFEVINITNAKWRGSAEPLKDQKMVSGFDDELSRFTMGYLHHLFDTQEMLAYRLATIVNVSFYLELFRRLRQG
jgi:queuine tRNA-ribosyltransferase